jgi:hypothetical protein
MPMRTSRCKRGAHVRALRRKARSRTTGINTSTNAAADVLPAPAPHLQDKCASVSYVSPCSIVAIIITSQSCALTIRAFNGDPRAQHLRYVYAWCPVHTTRSRRAGTPRSESVPDTPARGLLVPRAYQAADDLGPPLSGHFSFA